MTGRGRAGGAGTIINAMATGRGVAFGLELRVEAEVSDASRWTVHNQGRRLGPKQAALAVASAARVSPRPLRIEVRSQIPAERGLKSSSAVSVATIRAALAHHKKKWSDRQVLNAAAEAGLASGTSVTGAFDDAAACLLGGIVFTDNRRRRILARRSTPRGLVALVNPGGPKLPTRRVRGVDFEPVRALVTDAETLAASGDLRSAMLLNTAAYAPLFGHRALFSLDAVREGAYAAGLSGKGPAEIALATPGLAQRLRRRWPHAFIVRLRDRRLA